jgi:hypothetical protein
MPATLATAITRRGGVGPKECFPDPEYEHLETFFPRGSATGLRAIRFKRAAGGAATHLHVDAISRPISMPQPQPAIRDRGDMMTTTIGLLRESWSFLRRASFRRAEINGGRPSVSATSFAEPKHCGVHTPKRCALRASVHGARSSATVRQAHIPGA